MRWPAFGEARHLRSNALNHPPALTGIEQIVDPSQERVRGERLSDEGDVVVEHAVVNDGVLGVAAQPTDSGHLDYYLGIVVNPIADRS